MPKNVSNFHEYLDKKNFIFDEEIVENFLLSLRAKPFVILTGNSGTGKTKLAQLFGKYCFLKEGMREDRVIIYCTIEKNKMTPSVEEFDGIFPLNKFDVEAIIEGNDEAKTTLSFSLNTRASQLKAEANTYKKNLKNNYINYIPLYLETGIIEKTYNKQFFEENDTLILKRNKKSHETWQWSPNVKDIDFIPFNENIKVKRFGELDTDFNLEMKYKIQATNRTPEFEDIIRNLDEGAEINLKLDFSNLDESIFENNEKTISNFNFSKLDKRIFEPQHDKNELNICRYEIISVGANWTDNRNILGYENIITDSFHSTPALELILRAKNDLTHPYFLILDEMNLSHVERYFADFLSAIESGEPINLYDLKAKEGYSEVEFEKYKININGLDYNIPQKLLLPPNLFIIGTVNVDETTYMFSPKVLDRANVIEFETFPINEYMRINEIGEEELELKYDIELEDILKNSINEKNIRNMNKEDLSGQLNDDWNDICKELTKFQIVLKESGFDFGFRVTNEILRYIVLFKKYDKGENTNWKNAFDSQIKQKILPKLHGSENVIGETIENLIKLTYYGSDIVYSQDTGEFLKELANKKMTEEGTAAYENSYKKLLQMKKTLDKQRYVSFIN